MADTAEREDGGNVPGMLGYLARAWDFAWAFRLACVVLFADIWLNWRAAAGVLTWHLPSPDLWWRGGSEILAGVLAFSLAVSLGIPFLAYVVEFIARQIAIYLPSFGEEAAYIGESQGYVSVEQLRDYAHRQKDSMALQVADDHLKLYQTNRSHSARVGSLTFCVLALSVADLPPCLPANAHSLVGTILSSGTVGSVLIYSGFVGTVALLRAVWFEPPGPFKVRYWPAAEESAKKRRGLLEAAETMPTR